MVMQDGATTNAAPGKTGDVEDRADHQKIAAYIKILEQKELKVAKRHEYLTKMRIRFQERIDERHMKEPLAQIHVGPTMVEMIRQHGQNDEKVMEEACCILYYVSLMDPAFKKGVARLFQAMKMYPDNTAVQWASLAAIQNVVSANPDSLSRIAPSLMVIVAAMDKHSQHAKLQESALKLLGNLAGHAPTKLGFIQDGSAMGQILSAMRFHRTNTTIQICAYRALSMLSLDAPIEVKQKMLKTSMTSILNGMREHPNVAKIQLYGCYTLGNLLVGDNKGSANATNTSANSTNNENNNNSNNNNNNNDNSLNTSSLSTASAAAVSLELIQAMVKQGILVLVLNSMMDHADNEQVQTKGLKVVSYFVVDPMKYNDHQSVKDIHELFFSEGGLDIVLYAMQLPVNSLPIAQSGCEVLRNFTRLSLDCQRAVSAKGGIHIVLHAMRQYEQTHKLQDHAFACMRNLCLHQDNRLWVKEEGGIKTLLTNMTIYAKDAAIQAYGCDALGRLATEPENQVSIEAEHGIYVAIKAMQEHSGHPGVQDRAIFMLLALSEHKPALMSMKIKKILPLLQAAKIPPKQPAIERWEKLKSRVERSGWFSG